MLPTQQLGGLSPWPPDAGLMDRMDDLAHKGSVGATLGSSLSGGGSLLRIECVELAHPCCGEPSAGKLGYNVSLEEFTIEP